MAFLDREYTNEGKIEQYLNATISQGDARPYILSAQRFIEQYTERVFVADSTATARLFSGNDTQELPIDDCISISTVEVGVSPWGDSYSTVTAGGADGYYTMPVNNTAYDLPINKILLRSRIWIRGHANHRITAKWGYSEKCPEDISYVATVLASGMYYANRGENSGAITSERIGEYSVSYSSEAGFNDMKSAMDILDRYKRIRL